MTDKPEPEPKIIRLDTSKNQNKPAPSHSELVQLINKKTEQPKPLK